MFPLVSLSKFKSSLFQLIKTLMHLFNIQKSSKNLARKLFQITYKRSRSLVTWLIIMPDNSRLTEGLRKLLWRIRIHVECCFSYVSTFWFNCFLLFGCKSFAVRCSLLIQSGLKSDSPEDIKTWQL